MVPMVSTLSFRFFSTPIPGPKFQRCKEKGGNRTFRANGENPMGGVKKTSGSDCHAMDWVVGVAIGADGFGFRGRAGGREERFV
jgi:hypothetical protein